MPLRIKKGSKIYAYGQAGNAFTDQSDLNQAILEHLQSRFPDEIEEVETENKNLKKAK